MKVTKDMSKMIHGLHTPSNWGTSSKQADAPPAHALPMDTVEICNTSGAPRGAMRHMYPYSMDYLHDKSLAL
jgi:hypothetical protein